MEANKIWYIGKVCPNCKNKTIVPYYSFNGKEYICSTCNTQLDVFEIKSGKLN